MSQAICDRGAGDPLGVWTFGPITRHQLALYCGGSGDHNPIHVDSDFARATGLPDVIAHGMLVMAYAGRALGQLAPQDAVKNFKLRFEKPSRVGDVLTVSAALLNVDLSNACNARLARVKLSVTGQDGAARAQGEACVQF